MGSVLDALSSIWLAFEKCWDIDWMSGLQEKNIESFDPQFLSLHHPLCKWIQHMNTLKIVVSIYYYFTLGFYSIL
jgi:hypothetical protein